MQIDWPSLISFSILAEMLFNMGHRNLTFLLLLGNALQVVPRWQGPGFYYNYIDLVSQLLGRQLEFENGDLGLNPDPAAWRLSKISILISSSTKFIKGAVLL